MFLLCEISAKFIPDIIQILLDIFQIKFLASYVVQRIDIVFMADLQLVQALRIFFQCFLNFFKQIQSRFQVTFLAGFLHPQAYFIQLLSLCLDTLFLLLYLFIQIL